MSKNPFHPHAQRSNEEGLARLRRRMIRQTEQFINQRLHGRDGGFPADGQAGARLDPRGKHHDRRQTRPRGEEGIDIRTRPNCGTLVEVRPNQRGVVDNQRLQALEGPLLELASDRAAGDIVLGLQHVTVMTAGFLSVLAAIKTRLDCQERRLTVCDLQPQCAELFRGTGLEQIVHR